MQRVVVIGLVLAMVCSPAASSQETGGSAGFREAERIQQTRNEVETATGKDASPAELRKGAVRLEEALAFLDQPDVREIAVGNDFLHGRGHDVRYDLARLYARLGDKERALATIEAAQRIVWLPEHVLELGKDEAFAGLRGEPRFAQILARAQVAERTWSGPAAGVPYKERLSVEERIAGLTQFWSEARAHFVYFDHVPGLDWNRVYLDYLPKVMATETTHDYYRVMMQLAPLLKDGHTNIYPPEELAGRFFTRPPVRTALVEDRVLVLRVDSPSLANKVRPGDEVVAVDGVAVRRYAEERVAPFVSSSTPQDRSVRMYRYQLLAGDARTPVALTLRDAGGRTREVQVARSGYQDIVQHDQFDFRMLPGGVAYFALDHFENDAGVKAFEAALPRIMEAKALIIDVRENGGGSTSHGHKVLSYLSQGDIAATPQYVRADNPYMRAQGLRAIAWMPAQRFGAPAAVRKGAHTFAGKVVVLTGPRTFSAAEDFVLAFNALKRGTTIGESTGGSTGQPLSLTLPGGGSARICIKRDLTPDGRDFVGKGIVPDLPVAPTVETVRAGRDSVLEHALARLREEA